MGELADRQQRDHRAVVRQGVHAARSHGGDAVQQLGADAGGGGHGQVLLAEGLQRDGHAAGGRTGDAGEDVHRHRLGDQRVAGDAQYQVTDDDEAGQGCDHCAVTHLGGSVENRQHGAEGTIVDALLQVHPALPVHGDQQHDGGAEGDDDRPDTDQRLGVLQTAVFRLGQVAGIYRRQNLLGHQEVQRDHHEDWQQCQPEAGNVAALFADRIIAVFAVAFAGGHQLARLRGEPPGAEAEHDQAGDHPQARRGEGIGAEEGVGNGVLDRRSAGQRGHGEGERAEGDGTGDQALGNARFAKQRSADRIHGEGHHEQRHAAVGEDAAGQHDGQDGALAPHFRNYAVGDGARRSRVVHQLAEQGAEQEQREELDHVAAHGLHEHLGVGGQQQADVAGKQQRQQGQQRSEDQDVDAAVREVHQQGERNQNTEGTHGWFLLLLFCRLRAVVCESALEAAQLCRI